MKLEREFENLEKFKKKRKHFFFENFKNHLNSVFFLMKLIRKISDKGYRTVVTSSDKLTKEGQKDRQKEERS